MMNPHDAGWHIYVQWFGFEDYGGHALEHLWGDALILVCATLQRVSVRWGASVVPIVAGARGNMNGNGLSVPLLVDDALHGRKTVVMGGDNHVGDGECCDTCVCVDYMYSAVDDPTCGTLCRSDLSHWREAVFREFMAPTCLFRESFHGELGCPIQSWLLAYGCLCPLKRHGCLLCWHCMRHLCIQR